jgi:murein L,D-transpeptidase YcbB/YkuD
MAWAAGAAGECGISDAGPTPGAVRDARPDTSSALALRLNIPAYRLDVLEGATVTREITVAVGTPDHPTPIGEFEVIRAIWNPWWIPPPFEWAKDEKVTPPGPDNPTGRVKLYFGHYLFLHGTPTEASLGHAASHGCVRMANADAIALARIVHAHASPGLAPALLDSLEADPDRTRTIGLETPVTLAIRYDLIEVRRGWIEVHEDIYRRGTEGSTEALAALERAGIEPERVDRAELTEALHDRAPFAIPLAEVLRPSASQPAHDGGGVPEPDP